MAKDRVRFDRKLGKFTNLSQGVVSHLEKMYPHVQVELELSKMAAWLQSPAGSKRQGTLSFITNWLARSSGRASPPWIASKLDPSLSILMQHYLEGLWQNREHILVLNTINR